MKHLTRNIDFHLIAIGAFVTLLFAGFMVAMKGDSSMNRSFVSCFVIGLVPHALFLGFPLLTRVGDYRKMKKEALNYFLANTSLLLAYATLSAAILYFV